MIQVLSPILVVWLQALLVWTTGSPPYVPLIASFIAALRLLLPYPLLFGSRTSWCLLVVIAAVAAAAAYHTTYSEEATARFLPAPLTLFTASFLLLLQASMVLRQAVGGALPNYFPGLGALTCACTLNQTIELSERAMFAALSIVCVVCCGLLFQLSTGSGEKRTGGSALRRKLLVAVLVFSALGAWAGAEAWEAGVTRVQVMLPGWLEQATGYNRASRGYVRLGALGSITAEQQSDPMHVALRVYAKNPPGYLRGRAFDLFYRSQWRSAVRRRSRWQRPLEWRSIAPVAERPDGIPAPASVNNLFALDERATQPFVSIEVHNDPKRGQMFFTPLGASHVEGEGGYVSIDRNQVVQAGIKAGAPYTAYVPRSALQHDLAPSLRTLLLIPPDQLDRRVDELAGRVCRGKQTPQQKIRAIEAFFREEFSYSLEPIAIPSGADPLSHFLMNRSAAHCEFFASGAAALLRLQGVPCRYVTGYVVTELEGEYGDYWLARNRNAHAWVEAYDDDRGRWVVVEATPGIDVPREADMQDEELEGAEAGGAGEDGADEAQYPWLERGWLGRRWQTLIDYLKLPLLACGIVVITLLFVFRARLQPCSKDPASRRVARMQRLLTRMERRLRRRNLIRQPQETLHQFAERLRRSANGDLRLERCADWFLTYARVRYAGDSSSEQLLFNLP